jgi:hypothetical protein
MPKNNQKWLIIMIISLKTNSQFANYEFKPMKTEQPMKIRISKVLLLLPCLLIDTLTLPICIINWILTGNWFMPLSQQLTEQEDGK